MKQIDSVIYFKNQRDKAFENYINLVIMPITKSNDNKVEKLYDDLIIKERVFKLSEKCYAINVLINNS
jgi:hypothetical protein